MVNRTSLDFMTPIAGNRVITTLIMILLTSSSAVIFSNHQFAYGPHVIEEFDVPKRPLGMSIADGMLYFADIGESSVSVINTTTTDRTVRTINTTDAVSAVYAVPQLGKLYVSIFEGGRVEVYDLETHDFVNNITLPGSSLDFWLDPRESNEQNVTFLTGGVSMDYDPTTAMLYVALYNHDHVEVIDTMTDTAVKSIDVPEHPFAIKADPEAKMILVASLTGNRLSFISTDTNEVVGSMNTGNSPWGLDIDISRHIAYVTHRGSYYAAAVDIATQEVIARIPITDVAQAVAVDSNEHKVYFSFLEKQDIIKINGETNQVETVIEMDQVPWELVADPLTHRVYASTQFGDRVIAIGPQSMSASFPVVTLDSPAAVLGIMKAHGQSVVVSEPLIDVANKTLYMVVSTEAGGDLTLVLPRHMIDSRQGNSDTRFQVMIDGNPAEYEEEPVISSEDGSESRQMTISIPADSTRLDVVGTHVLER
jgi:YVTN family beta-propeller protein